MAKFCYVSSYLSYIFHGISTKRILNINKRSFRSALLSCKCLSSYTSYLSYSTCSRNSKDIDSNTKINNGDISSLDYGSKLTLSQRIVYSFPVQVQPFLKLMRLDRPIGTYLLFWPCSWSIALAAQPGSFPDPALLIMFALGATVMRSAGCTINDMWDRNLDKKTTTSSQQMVGKNEQLRDNGLVVLYPLMKRITYWPQLMLGFTFNWGALLGWTAVKGYCALSICLPLYFSAVCWTIIYDTIYAHQDKHDDNLIGIKSTALKFGYSTKKWLSGFSILMMSGLLVTGYSTSMSWPYYIGVAASYLHVVNQIYRLNIDDPLNCGNTFRSNRHLGLIIFLGIALGVWMQDKEVSKIMPEKLVSA